jgi:ATP-dependent RNA circularization protein (DNA/RNA ligase family)
MRMFFSGMMIVVLTLTLVACNKKLTNAELPVNVSEGGIYYTQVTMHYEKNVYPTTNYQVGAMIPVNTQVKLLEMKEKTIAIELNGGQTITVKNIEKHTGDNTQQAFNKLFAKQQVNLSQFSSLEAKNIESGTVTAGMSKKAVTAAIGYPPITRTLNLEANSWVYWRNRFNTFIVNFKNGKVSDIVD